MIDPTRIRSICRRLVAGAFLSLHVGTIVHAAETTTAGDTRASDTARKGLSRQGEYAPSFKVPEYDRARVKALADQANKRGEAEFARLKAKGALGTENLSPPDGDAAAGESRVARKPVEGRVVVALSSSMPEAMLASYMLQLDRHPESLVILRGFVGGAQKVRPTGLLMEKIRRKRAGDSRGDHYAVETVVDPMVFTQLGIDQVPAVAYFHGVQELSHCDEEDYSKAVVVFGAVSVEAALREARKAGARVPESVLASYRGVGWERKAP